MKQSALATLLLLAFLSLSACRAAEITPVIGILSATGTDHSTSTLAGEQEKGYGVILGGGDSAFESVKQAESTAQDEIQKTIRSLVEDDKQPVSAILGGTSNEATMRAAALVNFFNVPMLIPTASGDNLVPSNNLWAFRLSAPGAAYANYFFNTVLNKTNINRMEIEPDTLSSFKIAILYEQNTFGESAAVASAQAAMQQLIDIDPEKSIYGMEIAVYGSFPEKTLDQERLNVLVSQVKAQKAQLVYLVTDDVQIAVNLVRVFRAQYGEDETPLPVLVGQGGAFASQTFAKTPEAKDIYLLRQQWNRERCPEAITSFYEAQAYGAAYLLNFAIQQVKENQPAPTWGLKQKSDAELRTKFREDLRDKLKNTPTHVPCFGPVSFDNSGQNRELKFEFINISDGREKIMPAADFLEILKKRILLDELF